MRAATRRGCFIDRDTAAVAVTATLCVAAVKAGTGGKRETTVLIRKEKKKGKAQFLLKNIDEMLVIACINVL